MLASGGLTVVLLLVAMAAASSALAQPAPETPGDSPTIIGDLGELLVVLAVVVLIVESALAAIFNWRVYRMLFNNRAVKTVIMVVVGLLIVKGFNYDVFSDVMTKVTEKTQWKDWAGWVSVILSALIIAGGSEGVNTIFVRLGVRNPVQSEPVKPKLGESDAWISVQVKRDESVVGPVHIGIQELTALPATPPLAGTVDDRSAWARLKMAFTTQAARFPGYGGRTVKANTGYKIEALGKRVETTDGDLKPFTVTIYEGSFASRAIIDFTVDVSAR